MLREQLEYLEVWSPLSCRYHPALKCAQRTADKISLLLCMNYCVVGVSFLKVRANGMWHEYFTVFKLIMGFLSREFLVREYDQIGLAEVFFQGYHEGSYVGGILSQRNILIFLTVVKAFLSRMWNLKPKWQMNFRFKHSCESKKWTKLESTW